MTDEKPEVVPFAYAYRYHNQLGDGTVIRFESGPWNGQEPIEAIPLYTRTPETVDQPSDESRALWPNIIAPPMYENPAQGWKDPELPDFTRVWAVARKCGYSVGIHGSLKRDVDLIAAPWIADHGSAKHLVTSICEELNAAQIGEPENKPCGRTAYTLQIRGYFKPIDLSIMPALTAQKPAAAENERLADYDRLAESLGLTVEDALRRVARIERQIARGEKPAAAVDLEAAKWAVAQHCARQAEKMGLDIRQGFELGLQAIDYLSAQGMLTQPKGRE